MTEVLSSSMRPDRCRVIHVPDGVNLPPGKYDPPTVVVTVVTFDARDVASADWTLREAGPPGLRPP